MQITMIFLLFFFIFGLSWSPITGLLRDLDLIHRLRNQSFNWSGLNMLSVSRVKTLRKSSICYFSSVYKCPKYFREKLPYMALGEPYKDEGTIVIINGL